MAEMSIGGVARLAGIAPSAIRYYERAGLLSPPTRVNGRRRYAPAILGRLRIVQLARDAGFSIAETRTFLTGFAAGTPPVARWRALAAKKLAQLDAQLLRIAQMRQVLESSFRCKCPRIEDCEKAMARACRAR